MSDRTKNSSVPTEVVRVPLGDRSYDVVIGAGLLAQLGVRAATVIGDSRSAAVITNSTVAPLYAASVTESLKRAGFTATVIEVPEGEEHKSFASLQLIYDHLIR